LVLTFSANVYVCFCLPRIGVFTANALVCISL